jgi:hypothetical protein
MQLWVKIKNHFNHNPVLTLSLDNRRQLLGDALFLYLASINEITDSEGKLTENEKIEVERYVEMINLATFAFHVFYAMEIETCLSAFFRTFAPLINDYCSAERNMYTILRMALFRQRIIASNNIELEIGSIIDKTFPSKDFTTYYFRTDAPYNEKTIEWLLELRNEVKVSKKDYRYTMYFNDPDDLQVLDIPVETLDPEDFAGEEAIRERLTEFIGFRYVKYRIL